MRHNFNSNKPLIFIIYPKAGHKVDERKRGTKWHLENFSVQLPPPQTGPSRKNATYGRFKLNIEQSPFD